MINVLNLLMSIDRDTIDLYSPILGDVNLSGISENNIIVSKNDMAHMNFTFNEFGQFNYCGIISPECLLFVKGKTWEEVFKSTLKNGDFLIRRIENYQNKRGVDEYEYYYIEDIDNGKIYNNISGPRSSQLSDIDIDKYHLLDHNSDEAMKFYNSIVYEEIFDSTTGIDIFESIINNLFKSNSIKLDKITYNKGEFTVTISYDNSPVNYYINLNNRCC